MYNLILHYSQIANIIHWLPNAQIGEVGPPQASAHADAAEADEFASLFDAPVGAVTEDSQMAQVEDLDETAFLPLSQKVSLSPLHEESVAASASELLYSELSDRTNQLKLAQKEVQEYKLKCRALMSSLSETKKRVRVEAAAMTPDPDQEDDAAPKKRPSPSNEESASKQPPPAVAGDNSDDEVPPPEPPPLEPVSTEKVRPFQRLGSILCGYKDDQVTPGSEDLPFDLCAELCKEEAEEVAAWDSTTCESMHDAVMSALRLVYPHKKEIWFSKPFLVDPRGAATYWSRVLMRRHEIWSAAAKKAAALRKESLTQKIRRKIRERSVMRSKALSKAALLPKGDPFKTPVRRQHSGLSSDSDDENHKVIDLSQSPASASSSSSSTGASKAPPKAAPHPK